jgi:hypothetical protein
LSGSCTAARGRPFTFQGSKHYRFRDGLIDEFRQYWTCKPARPGSARVGFDYSDIDRGADATGQQLRSMPRNREAPLTNDPESEFGEGATR